MSTNWIEYVNPAVFERKKHKKKWQKRKELSTYFSLFITPIKMMPLKKKIRPTEEIYDFNTKKPQRP